MGSPDYTCGQVLGCTALCHCTAFSLAACGFKKKQVPLSIKEESFKSCRKRELCPKALTLWDRGVGLIWSSQTAAQSTGHRRAGPDPAQGRELLVVCVVPASPAAAWGGASVYQIMSHLFFTLLNLSGHAFPSWYFLFCEFCQQTIQRAGSGLGRIHLFSSFCDFSTVYIPESDLNLPWVSTSWPLSS